jgi:carboxylesterase
MDDKIPEFQNPDLKGGSFQIAGSSTGVLLIHGFTATTTEVAWLAAELGKKGFTVYAPLLPGHGTHPSDLNRQKMADWLNCVENAIDHLRKRCKQVIVGGESMGAVLALYLAERNPEISSLLIYSPAIHVHEIKFAKYLKWIKPVLVKSNYDPRDKDWQGYTVYPMRAAHEFNKLQKLVERRLQDINQPALILQGIYDKTIDEDCGKFIYDSIQSSNKEFLWMKHSGHVMLLGREFDRISRLTVQFLKSVNIL